MLLWAKPEKAGPQKVCLGFKEDLLGGGVLTRIQVSVLNLASVLQFSELP